MEKYTQKSKNGRAIPRAFLTETAEGYIGPAADRLAALEELMQSLLAERESLAQELAQLRAEGRIKTTRFNQLLARKLTISQMMSAFRAFGVLSPADDA